MLIHWLRITGRGNTQTACGLKRRSLRGYYNQGMEAAIKIKEAHEICEKCCKAFLKYSAETEEQE